MRALRRFATGSAAAAIVLCIGATARAQTSDARFEAGAGLRRTGAMSLGSADANQTRGDGGTARLFAVDSRLEGANGFEGRFGVRLTETIWVEGSGSYGTSDLTVRITSDAEGIPDVTATEAVQQYTVEGSVLLAAPGFGRGVMPFVSGGGGYARYRHEARTFGQDGFVWHLGGGVNFLLADAFVIRLDARALFRRDGVAFDDRVHTIPAFGASAFVRF